MSSQSEQLARACGVVWIDHRKAWAPTHQIDRRVLPDYQKATPGLFVNSLPAREFALTVAWGMLQKEWGEINLYTDGKTNECSYCGHFATPAEAINRALAAVLLRDEEETTDV